MRKIAASYIFPILSKPIKQGTIILSDDGEILDILETNENLHETASTEYYNGILVPGFINAHCHLELSYLKGLMSSASGLPDFIRQIMTKRFSLPVNLNEIIQNANDEMKSNGIVAVGDISNDNFSFEVKKNSKIYYHTFVEVFNPDTKVATSHFKKGLELYTQLNQNNLSASIVPHAPYSMSGELLQLIKQHAHENNCVYSIHNQETVSEDELFLNGTGEIRQLFSELGFNMDYFNSPTGKSSLQSMANYMPENNTILLIHNVHTKQQDIDIAKSVLKSPYWISCPKSNRIIENKLPDLNLFIQNNLDIAIGTDSYSSNTSLSIIEELQTIQKFYPDISLATLLQWATLNGAKALQIANKYGSFEKGKKPGLNLITGIDFENMKLTENSKVKVLV